MRLALEVLSTSGIPWAVYYIRRRTGLVLASAYGINGNIPQILGEDALKAIDGNVITYMDTQAEIFEPCIHHVFIHPELIELPARVHEEMSRIASLSVYTNIAAALDVPEAFEESHLIEYLKAGIARNFSYASLFVINLTSLSVLAKKHCAHAGEGSILEELATFICTITGSTRNVFVLPGARLLCAVLTHKPGDPELIATLVSKTLLRLISRTPSETIPLGPFASVKLSNEGLEPALRSLINEI